MGTDSNDVGAQEDQDVGTHLGRSGRGRIFKTHGEGRLANTEGLQILKILTDLPKIMCFLF